jgi:hypothetical protein
MIKYERIDPCVMGTCFGWFPGRKSDYDNKLSWGTEIDYLSDTLPRYEFNCWASYKAERIYRDLLRETFGM